MEWAVNTPGGQVRMSDLPLAVVAQLEADLDTAWWDFASHPFRYAKTASYVYAAACSVAGVDPEELKLGQLVETFSEVEDDQPITHDPNTGLPNTGGAPEMTGSSGAPGDSDGPPT